MNTNKGSRLSRNKWILVLIGVPVLGGAWWAFRPEKLFINQKVSEAAPAALSLGSRKRCTPESWKGRFTRPADERRFTRTKMAKNTSACLPPVRVPRARPAVRSCESESRKYFFAIFVLVNRRSSAGLVNLPFQLSGVQRFRLRAQPRLAPPRSPSG